MKTPEKIYGWLDSQLSVARFYGSIKLNGATYVIDESDPRQPLVRQDVVKSEKKKIKKMTKEEAQAKLELLLHEAPIQGEIF
jgi:peroxiredoxin family protein